MIFFLKNCDFVRRIIFRSFGKSIIMAKYMDEHNITYPSWIRVLSVDGKVVAKAAIPKAAKTDT